MDAMVVRRQSFSGDRVERSRATAPSGPDPVQQRAPSEGSADVVIVGNAAIPATAAEAGR